MVSLPTPQFFQLEPNMETTCFKKKSRKETELVFIGLLVSMCCVLSVGCFF